MAEQRVEAFRVRELLAQLEARTATEGGEAAFATFHLKTGTSFRGWLQHFDGTAAAIQLATPSGEDVAFFEIDSLLAVTVHGARSALGLGDAGGDEAEPPTLQELKAQASGFGKRCALKVDAPWSTLVDNPASRGLISALLLRLERAILSAAHPGLERVTIVTADEAGLEREADLLRVRVNTSAGAHAALGPRSLRAALDAAMRSRP